jgi:hypothetical protein
MEAMLGISLYSYLYLKLAKILSFLLSLMFSLQQNWRRRGQNRICLEARGWGGEGGGGRHSGGGGEMAQTMYAQMNKEKKPPNILKKKKLGCI